MQVVTCCNITELKSVIDLLCYIDQEIGEADRFAQQLIRVGTEILRDKAKDCARLVTGSIASDQTGAGQRADAIKLVG
jgi:hypothetical protein